MSGRLDTVRYDRIQILSPPTVSRQSTLQFLQLEEDYNLRWIWNIPRAPFHDRINFSFEPFVLNRVVPLLGNLLQSAVVPKQGNKLFAGLHFYSLLLLTYLILNIRLHTSADTKNTEGFRNKRSVLVFHWAVIVLKNQPFCFRISNTAHAFVWAV